MQPKNFSIMHLFALVVANIGAIIWLHIPSIYLRAMFGPGNSFTMVELWDSMLLLRTLTPWVYDNSLTAALPFLHISIDMSVLFLVFLPLAYLGNLAFALYHLDREDHLPFSLLMVLPGVPGLGWIASIYVALTFILMAVFQLLAIPVIFTSIFVVKNTIHLVTLLVFIAMATITMAVFKLNED